MKIVFCDGGEQSGGIDRDALYRRVNTVDRWGNMITMEDIHYAEYRGIDINSTERLLEGDRRRREEEERRREIERRRQQRQGW